LMDVLNVNFGVNAALTITSGVFDAFTNLAAINANSFQSNNANTRTVSLGGTLTSGGAAGGAATVFTLATTTGLTFNKNSANIVVLAPTSPITPWIMAFGNLTYNDITFNTVTGPNAPVSISGNATFANWNVNPGWYFIPTSSQVITVSNPFTWAGTLANPIALIAAGTNLSSISCPSGACSIKNGIVGGITATGGATFIGTNCYQVGSATGWTLTPPADATPTGLAALTATAVWQDLLASGDFGTAGSVGALIKALGNLQFTVPAIARGTVASGSTTTSINTSAFDPPGAAANQFADGVVVFDKNTATAALRGQKKMITASSNAGAPTLTVGALTTTPAAGDTFSVV
jgi:hypothetical protein